MFCVTSSAVRQLDRRLERRVVAQRVHRAHRVGELERVEAHARLDQVQHQRGRAHLQVRGRLGEVRVTDDHVQAAVLVRVRVRLVAGVDDAALQRGLEPDLDLDVVGTLGQLEPGFLTGGADADPAGTADDLPRREERRQPGDDRGERGAAGHQVVLVGAVARALAVHVVLVKLQARLAGHGGGAHGGLLHHPLPRLVPDDGVARVGDLGCGVLRVRVVDVQARAVGEDDVRGPEVLHIRVRRRHAGRAEVETPRVPQWRLDLVVPAGAPRSRDVRGRGVGQYDLCRGQYRVGGGVSRDGDPVLHLGTHDPAHDLTLRGCAPEAVRSWSTSPPPRNQKCWSRSSVRRGQPVASG